MIGVGEIYQLTDLNTFKEVYRTPLKYRAGLDNQKHSFVPQKFCFGKTV